MPSRSLSVASDRSAPGRASSFAEVETALLARWPETRLEPTLERIRRLCELLDYPQRATPAVHLTGTNGKTSTARMIDALLRASGLRTGRFTSPHLESMTERISIDGARVSEEAFVAAYRRVAAAADQVDQEQAAVDGPRLSFFEMSVAMALAAFRDAAVDATVIEVGMGGTWDATNVVDAPTAVLLPVDVDHADYLGATPEQVAREKAGIIKPGATAVVAEQVDGVDRVIAARAADVGARVAREGVDLAVTSRTSVTGGQVVSLRGLHGRYDDVFLPLYGAHQAQNAAVAVAATESLLRRPIPTRRLQQAFADVTSPGRLEVVSAQPHIVLDAAHNPHGAAAAAAAIREATGQGQVVGVVAVMADKDCRGILEALAPALSTVVCTQNSTLRSMPAERLGEIARSVFDPGPVHVEPDLGDALALAVDLADSPAGDPAPGAGSVLVTGSVVTAGEARALLTTT